MRHAPLAVVVVKSTVPPGTQIALRSVHPGLRLVSNPEFLQQGSAVKVALNPDRIVIGTNDPAARSTMHDLYATLESSGTLIIDASPESAELIKYASNSFLAMKIAFINEIADLCEATGANIDAVAFGVGLDPRIGDQFLCTGPGYGGSCLPKDTEALVASARAFGVELSIIDAVSKSNGRRRSSLAARVLSAVGPDVNHPHVGVLGLTFKAGTDDLRESPAVDLVAGLIGSGAAVTVFDPLGDASTAPAISAAAIAAEAIGVADGADVVVVATEWPEFIDMDFGQMAQRMRGSLIVDLSNILDPRTVADAGMTLRQIGKPSETG
jgi:UDPglucose 6-dehydrogenase